MAYIGVSPSNGVRRVHTYTATASQTTFSGAGAEGTSLSYKDSNFVDVYQNGIKLGDADYTSTSGTSIVLAQGASVDDIVVVVVFDVFSVADTVSKADGGTFDGNVTMAGTLGVTGALSAKGGAVFNEDSADVDFRVESDGNANAFFLEGSTGNVGIGTVSPSDLLELSGSTAQPAIRLNDTDVSGLYHRIFTPTNTGLAISADTGNVASDSFLRFDVDGSEAMRIDSSGNLLVSTTDANPGNNSGGSDVGILLGADGKLVPTANNSEVCVFNRQSSDGDIVLLRKDGSTVGSIGVNTDRVYLSTANKGIAIDESSGAILPVNEVGSNNDNSIDLGASSVRYDDVFATNGTIQTSDRNEKNTITDSDLGIDFIKKLSPKSYIFNGKTRTHYGLIAQDVETVLSDISKPTSGFAGFIKDDISEEKDGSQYRYGLRYTEFVAPLIKAVKDQQAIIEDLQARITALENAE